MGSFGNFLNAQAPVPGWNAGAENDLAASSGGKGENFWLDLVRLSATKDRMGVFVDNWIGL